MIKDKVCKWEEVCHAKKNCLINKYPAWQEAMTKFKHMDMPSAASLETQKSPIEVLDSDNEDHPPQETTPEKLLEEKASKPETLTPPKVASSQSTRRMSFPKISIKKLRVMSMKSPVGVQFGGRFYSTAKRMEIEEDLSKLGSEEESEESDSGSWSGPPVPAAASLDATDKFAMVPHQDIELPAPVLPQEGEVGQGGSLTTKAWGFVWQKCNVLLETCILAFYIH